MIKNTTIQELCLFYSVEWTVVDFYSFELTWKYMKKFKKCKFSQKLSLDSKKKYTKKMFFFLI